MSSPVDDPVRGRQLTEPAARIARAAARELSARHQGLTDEVDEVLAEARESGMPAAPSDPRRHLAWLLVRLAFAVWQAGRASSAAAEGLARAPHDTGPEAGDVDLEEVRNEIRQRMTESEGSDWESELATHAAIERRRRRRLVRERATFLWFSTLAIVLMPLWVGFRLFVCWDAGVCSESQVGIACLVCRSEWLIRVFFLVAGIAIAWMMFEGLRVRERGTVRRGPLVALRQRTTARLHDAMLAATAEARSEKEGRGATAWRVDFWVGLLALAMIVFFTFGPIDALWR